MQPNAFGSIKPAQLPCGLLMLFRNGQNSGWKIGSCGVHVCGLEQKKIRMGNRANVVSSSRHTVSPTLGSRFHLLWNLEFLLISFPLNHLR